jgi:hypothetical protein
MSMTFSFTEHSARDDSRRDNTVADADQESAAGRFLARGRAERDSSHCSLRPNKDPRLKCWQRRLTIARGSIARAIFAAAVLVCASEAASAQDAKNSAPPSQVIATGAPGDSATGEGPNTGQDITNPVTRVDLRANFQLTPGDRDSYTFIVRADKPYALGDGWKLGLRFDAPTIYNNIPSSDNPGGDFRLGFGNVLGQAILIKAIDQRQAFGFGGQIIVPTATAPQFGSSSVQLVPTIGYRYGLPEISKGSFFVAAARWDFDVGGQAGKRINNLQFSPTLNIALPDQYFITLYPSTDIHYELITRSWFVPLDAMVGKLWGKSVVTSLEVSVPMINGDAPLYKFKTEARVGFFF